MAQKSRKLTCIICPMSCILDVKYINKKIKTIKGHQCKKGRKYAEEELFDPKRTLTSTVKVNHGVIPLVSVRTDRPIPKNLIFPIMHEIMQLTLDAPIKLGDIIVKNIQNTDANLIATKTVAKSKRKIK